MAESHREEIAKLEALYASSPGGRVFVHLAEALRKAGDYERARGILSEGLGRHSDSASGHVVLGRLLTDLQADAEAEEAFRKVLQLDGGNLIALRGLADLALRGGRRQEAAGYYTDLLARNPAGDDVRHLLAELELGDAVAPQDVEEAARAGTLPTDDEQSSDWERDWASAGAAEHPDETVAPFSPAPGDTGEVEGAEPEFGFIEVDAEAVTEGADSFDAGLHGDSDWIIDPRDADLSELLGEEAAGTTTDFDLSELSLAPFDEPHDDDSPQAGREELPGIAPDTGMVADSLAAPQFEVIDPASAGLPEEPDVVEFIEIGQETGPAWPDEEIDDFPYGSLDDEAAPHPRLDHAAPDGLVTETMADLYSSQGFHDRAADMYRALLRQRPADASLTAKLQAAEAAQSFGRASTGADSVPTGADPVPSEVDDDGTDSWLQGLGAWTATPEELPDETPYAWTRGAIEDAAPEPAASAVPAIGAYLRELISWAPGEGTVDAAVDAPLADEEAAGSAAESAESAETGDPWAHSPADITESVADSAAAAEYEPWAFTPGDELVEGDPAAAADHDPAAAADHDPAAAADHDPAAAADHDPAAAADHDPAAAAEAPPAAAAEAPPATSDPEAPASAPPRHAPGPLDAVEAAFNEWYLGDEPAPAAEPREAAGTASPTVQPAAEEPRPAQSGPRLGDEPAEDEDEDEDLAMFRAWLQSLKK